MDILYPRDIVSSVFADQPKESQKGSGRKQNPMRIGVFDSFSHIGMGADGKVCNNLYLSLMRTKNAESQNKTTSVSFYTFKYDWRVYFRN